MYVLEPNVTSVAVIVLEAPGKTAKIGSFNLAPEARSSGLNISKRVIGLSPHD